MLPRGVEDLAREEALALGASEPRATSGGLALRGDLAVAYRLCLWSRLASRVLLPLARIPAGSSDQLHAGVRALPWEEHLDVDETFAVEARVRGDRAVNSHFVEMRTKDGIVDRLRDRLGRRPSVDRHAPSLLVHVLLAGGEAQLSLDLAGEPLHRRGYRGASGAAPLKENVAAALLLRAGWPAIAARGGGFLDPMCGAGTLLAEAALIAADVAPGLLRDRFGFHGWRGHDARVWREVEREAKARAEAGLLRLPPMAGSDADPAAVRRAEETLATLGLERAVPVRRADVADCAPPAGASPGLVATNAPYGHRIGGAHGAVAAAPRGESATGSALADVYRRLGEALKARFAGWSVALLTADATLAGEVRMRAFRRNALYNGALRCELLQYRVGETPGRPSAAAGDPSPG